MRKEGNDWVKKCMEYGAKGSKPRSRPNKTWREVVEKDCQARKLNKEVQWIVVDGGRMIRDV